MTGDQNNLTPRPDESKPAGSGGVLRVHPDAITDPAPKLEPLGPEFGPTVDPDSEDSGVDIASMPELRGMKGLLPSKRFHIKRQLIEIQQMIPEGILDGDPQAVNAAVLENIGQFDELLAYIEEMLLSQAKNHKAMHAWLCEQDNAEAALMEAFQVMAERLGN